MARPPGTPVLPGLGGSGAPAAISPAFNADALLASAIQAHDSGRLAEAERGYRGALAIAPRDARIPAHLGVLLLEQGRHAEGVALLDRSLALNPRQPDMLSNKGGALIALGRFAEAMAAYGLAIAQQPADARAAAYNNLGVYLLSLDRCEEAAQAYGEALALEPDFPEAWGNLGVAHLKAERPREAFAALERAVSLKPDYADAWTNRGAALQKLDRLDEALGSCDRALAADPAGAGAWNNRGMALQGLGRLEDALASYDRAIALQPDYADARWNKALGLILAGDYQGGWPLFEWRWKRSDPRAAPPRDFGAPPWLGESDLKGKTLLLHAEQGFGDTLQMLRYIPILADRGVSIALIVPEPLLELANTVRGLSAPAVTSGQMAFDAHTPLMSLPLALKTTLDTIPSAVPYLSVPPAARGRWAGRLGPKTRKRVGLTWSGNPGHRNDHNRSLTFDVLRPLLEAEADFHSLQKDYRPGELEALAADGRILDHAADLDSFSDTAALIEQMDVVIAVDTSTAHLAGALGRPLLLLLPFAPDYRWGLERPDSPWCPTARLIRQIRPGDWTAVIAEALDALKA